MPNILAHMVLILWPVITIILFKRLQPLQAAFWTIVAGHMFLPVKIVYDFPLIPPLDKGSIASVCALFGCIVIKKLDISLIPPKGIPRLITIILCVLPFFTVMTNTEAMYNGKWWIQGLSFKDGISFALAQYIVLIPLIIGLQLVKTQDDVKQLMKLLMYAGLVYSLFVLYEARMSPQLNRIFYGFIPPGWVQNIRMGGFRPFVFMGHGLWVATFIAVGLYATISLWKAKIKVQGVPLFFAVVYLAVTLAFCKTLGAYILAITFFLLIVLSPLNLIKRAAQVLVVIVILYPSLSISHLFPHEEILDEVYEFNEERGQSLQVRFDNELALLAHAQKKYYFGWGGWARNRLHDSVTDGFWIITLGIKGIVGFICIFGLMSIAVLKGIKAAETLESKGDKRLMYSLVIMVGLLMVDQIPNASISGYIWFIIGSLLGVSYQLLDKSARENSKHAAFQEAFHGKQNEGFGKSATQ
ncbi:hypothetical protein FLL45_06400 [Aliikangiella marina]|uniref:O-antigen ligase family protein n=1 Tax=Aliikangiella marina TaxID=1712262 RepID=A0A545TBJ6_9GAMM|nr:hypothetical protein [Aliikangiella marina]TQV74590.1 hypothetical protein FLL45_06400 [Aliikangiella marina]